MKSIFARKFINFGLILALAALSFSCDQSSKSQSANQEAVKAPTPREAYRLLYEAVKAKDSARIQQMMSKNTMTFAGFATQQQNQSLEKVFENGLTATTFSYTLPEMRDERISGNFGAVEVFNQKDNRWEDLPFVLEDGGWKLAVGDAFKGDYKSPGKGQAQLEMESSGAMGDFANATPSNTNARQPRIKNGELQSIEVPVENTNKTPAKANKK